MKNKRRVRADLQAQARMSLDIVTGAQNLATLSPQDLFDRERPEDMRAMFKLARKWHKEHWFVEQALKLQKAFLNYGLRLTAEDDRGRAQLKKFMADPRKKGALLRYIHTVWTEWLLQDNVVSFWRSEVTPYLLLGETCTYSDAMGIEKLKVDLGYKKGQLEGSGLSAEEIKRYTSREVTLSEDFDEYFEVLTRAPRGGGFAVPRLYRVFRVLSQCESMEVGETMLAYAGRLVVRMHRMGWEVKAGGNLAKQSEYLWKRERAKAIKDYFVGRQGYAETTGQFDHKIDIHWVDPKLYESRKWDTIISRLLWWAGPVGFMMMAKSASPFLLQMLKSDAEQDRPMVGAHLESVINQGFGIGGADSGAVVEPVFPRPTAGVGDGEESDAAGAAELADELGTGGFRSA